MTQTISDNSILLISVLVFLAIVLMMRGLYLAWLSYAGPAARQVERRIRALSGASDDTPQTQLLKERMLSNVPLFERLLLGLPRAHRLDKWIVQAGLEWTVSILVLASLLAGAACAAILSALAHQAFIVCLAAGTMVGVAPLFYVALKRQKRLRKIESQLPEALDFLTRGLRSGHAFSSALQMLGDEMADPIAGEFRVVHDEINFGVSLPQAMHNLGERVPITDLRYFIVAVLIQRESGGNLSEILSKLSHLMRERAKLISKVRVLCSEGKLSAWILGVMPFFMAAVMYYMNPEFMAPLWTDPIGIAIVKYMLGLMAAGILILKKITKIKV